eukprot:CAMPEP_0185920548 /NCGR_PEP_ID=MMETSP0924C-20121207/8062_1 /TAXON_ID=321610 /ORGANISM="Perkinsus chesapeaki, Strain ATCC PRA-65" /LENGTH=44 /DNA_ID= /DNA_START= /DNA_END= /DNA_ORIENTATION=
MPETYQSVGIQRKPSSPQQHYYEEKPVEQQQQQPDGAREPHGQE